MPDPTVIEQVQAWLTKHPTSTIAPLLTKIITEMKSLASKVP